MNKYSYPLIPCDNTEAVTRPSSYTPLRHFILLALTQRYTQYLRLDSLFRCYTEDANEEQMQS